MRETQIGRRAGDCDYSEVTSSASFCFVVCCFWRSPVIAGEWLVSHVSRSHWSGVSAVHYLAKICCTGWELQSFSFSSSKLSTPALYNRFGSRFVLSVIVSCYIHVLRRLLVPSYIFNEI